MNSHIHRWKRKEKTAISLFKAIELNMRMYEASDVRRCAPRNSAVSHVQTGTEFNNERTNSCREVSTLPK